METAQILIVEDEGIVAHDIRLTLEEMGYVVCAAVFSGEAAIEKTAELDPDLVLMDINLKRGMDGVEAADQIRARFDVPVVYLTSYADDETLHRAKVAAPFGYLMKPFDAAVLRTTIETALYKHEMERRLRESEQWLAAVLSSMGDGVIAVDGEGRVQFMNAVAEALTGWQQEDALGRDSEQVFRVVPGGTGARGPDEAAFVELGGRALLIRRDRTQVPVAHTAAPIQGVGERISGVVWAFRDIAEQVRLEGQLEAVYRLGRELTLLHDEGAILQKALETAADLFSYESIGYGLVDPESNDLVYHSRLVDGAPAAMDLRLPLDGDEGIGVAAILGGRSINVPDISQDSRYVPVSEDSAPQSELCVPMWAGGRVIGVLNAESLETDYFTPADERLLQTLANQTGVAVENARLYRSLQEQMQALQEAQAQLVHSEKMAALGRLVAAVAHEINNPLQSVLGFARLIRKELAGEARQERLTRHLEIVETEAERIAAIVRRVHDFYGPGRSGRWPTAVGDLLAGVLELAGEQLQQAGVTVETSGIETAPQIVANPDHLKQVFMNLVLNAVDAMPEGGTLRIRTSLEPGAQVAAGARFLRIEFSDTGVGMSPEIQAQLFEPFFTTKIYSSGLGLSASYQVIEAHGGQMTVESQEGVGTTFTILLPLAE
jgi:PAS domain S-box-containing protein